MEVLDNPKYKFDMIRVESRWLEADTRHDLLERLIGLFFLTKQDRLRAGIYVGWERRNWLEQSALVILPPPQNWD